LGEAVGSVAGDNTIFILMRDKESVVNFTQKFRKVLVLE